MWIRMWLRLCSREASCPPHPFPSCSHEPCPELGCDCRCVCTSLPWSRRRWIRGQCPSSTTLRCYYPAGGPAERRCEVRAAQFEAPGMTEAAGGNGCSPLEMLRRWVRRVSLTPLWHPAVRMTAVQYAKCVCGGGGCCFALARTLARLTARLTAGLWRTQVLTQSKEPPGCVQRWRPPTRCWRGLLVDASL